jgi:DNA polymerase phi
MTSSTSSSDEVVSTAPAGGANAGNRFMNWFWDLASDEATVRAQAGTMIVKFLQHSQSQQQSAASADLEYGVKRLVRGLSSSRLSARQGFAACLCEVLGTFGPVLVPSSEILRLIDESTQVTGAMKGSEERDALFGRLFGYVALIRAGRLTSDKMIAIDVFDRLLELFDAKPWFQEAVCEGLLSAYASLSGQADANKHALDRISALLRGTGVEDMTAAQLILLIGLQTHFETRSETEIEAFRELFPYKSIASLKKIESMSKTLIASCSGFPKVNILLVLSREMAILF